MKGWKREPSRLVYRHGSFQLREDRWTLPGDVHLAYPILRSPSFSCVVGLTDDHEVPLVENLHPSPGLHLLEVPGGRIEPRETPRAAARRELEEETGFRAKKLTFLGRYYPNPHWGTFQGHIFLGVGLRPGVPHPDDGEVVRPVLLPVRQVFQRLHHGGFLGGSTFVALHMAEEELRRMGLRLG